MDKNSKRISAMVSRVRSEMLKLDPEVRITMILGEVKDTGYGLLFTFRSCQYEDKDIKIFSHIVDSSDYIRWYNFFKNIKINQ